MNTITRAVREALEATVRFLQKLGVSEETMVESLDVSEQRISRAAAANTMRERYRQMQNRDK